MPVSMRSGWTRERVGGSGTGEMREEEGPVHVEVVRLGQKDYRVHQKEHREEADRPVGGVAVALQHCQ